MQINQNTSPFILWLTENYFPNTGGMAQSCDRIVYNLRNAGIRIGLVHFRTTKSAFKLKMVQNGFNLVVPVDIDETHSFNLLYNFLTNPEFSPCFSHIVAFGGYLPVLGAPIFSKLFDIPLVSLLRGNDFDLALFSARKRDVLFYALENSRTICTVSSEQVEKLKKLIVHNDIRYIPNGIDLNEWLPLKSEILLANAWKKLNVGANKKVIGVFGHLKPKKGIDFFLDAIFRSGNAENIFILITGDIFSEIVERLNNYNIQHYISGFMNRNELLAWYPACDAIAIPSFYDGMPNVLLESAALGIPVIAANTGGLKDILKDGVNSFVFHPGDMDACVNSINQFMNNKQTEIKELGKKLKELIENKFTAAIETKAYLDLFCQKS